MRWRAREVCVGVVVAGAGLAAGCATVATPAAVAPAANPDLVARCGIDINLVIDRSGSIGDDMDLVTAGAQSFVNAVSGTGSRVRTSSFSSTALVHPAGGAGTDVIDSLLWSSADGYKVPTLTAGGGTNMDAGLEVIRRAPGAQADLTLVFTDGKPNEHYLLTPNGHLGPWVNLGQARNQAVSEANAIKASGSHILAIGVGDADVATLADISGSDALGSGVPIEKVDYARVGSFGELERTFRELASRLCTPSLTITKMIQDGDGTLTPAPGWSFSINPRSPVTWVQPIGGPNPLVTGASGSATVVWSAPLAQSFVVRELSQVGYHFASVSCTEDLFDGSGPHPLTIDQASAFQVDVTGGAVRCVVVNAPDLRQGDDGDLVVRLPAPDGVDEFLDVNLVVTDAGGIDIDRATVPIGGRASFTLRPGDYTLRVDSRPVGWSLRADRCDGKDLGRAEPVPFSIGAGTTVACDLEFVPDASLGNVIIDTSYDRPGKDDDSVRWTLIDSKGAIRYERSGIIGSQLIIPVPPGGYSLLQTDITGRSELRSMTCDRVEVPVTGGFIDVIAGQDNSCEALYRRPE